VQAQSHAEIGEALSQRLRMPGALAGHGVRRFVGRCFIGGKESSLAESENVCAVRSECSADASSDKSVPTGDSATPFACRRRVFVGRFVRCQLAAETLDLER